MNRKFLFPGNRSHHGAIFSLNHCWVVVDVGFPSWDAFFLELSISLAALSPFFRY